MKGYFDRSTQPLAEHWPGVPAHHQPLSCLLEDEMIARLSPSHTPGRALTLLVPASKLRRQETTHCQRKAVGYSLIFESCPAQYH